LLAHIADCKDCFDYGRFQERVLDALSALRVRDTAPWHVKARVIDLLTSDGYAP
jgi:hypothetical protein